MHEVYKQKNLPYLTVKACPKCESLIEKDQTICPNCGYSFDSSNNNLDEFSTTSINRPVTSNVDSKPNNYASQLNQDNNDNSIVPSEAVNANKEVDDTKTEKHKIKTLKKRTICNIIGIVFFSIALVVLLFGNYMSLKTNPNKYELNTSGLNILFLKDNIFSLKKGDVVLYTIFGKSANIQKFGNYAITILYYLNLACLAFGILYFVINLVKKRRVSFRFIGWFIIPSAILYFFSIIHSIILEHSSFMKEMDLKVDSIANYVFISVFVAWVIIAFMLVKDSGEKIKVEKNKDDDLFDD